MSWATGGAIQGSGPRKIPFPQRPSLLTREPSSPLAHPGSHCGCAPPLLRARQSRRTALRSQTRAPFRVPAAARLLPSRASPSLYLLPGPPFPLYSPLQALGPLLCLMGLLLQNLDLSFTASMGVILAMVPTQPLLKLAFSPQVLFSYILYICFPCFVTRMH